MVFGNPESSAIASVENLEYSLFWWGAQILLGHLGILIFPARADPLPTGSFVADAQCSSYGWLQSDPLVSVLTALCYFDDRWSLIGWDPPPWVGGGEETFDLWRMLSPEMLSLHFWHETDHG